MSRSSSTASPPLSTTTSPNRSPSLHHTTPSMSDDENDGAPQSPPPPVTAKSESSPESPKAADGTTSARTPTFPVREDCWSEEATRTLIEAWGSHYLELNRGNLRQKHWQEVADAVNALHAHTKKLHRSDVQCKNRVDTVKKKYKIEKTKVVQSNGRYASTWPHFNSLDSLIGDSFSKANNGPSNGHKKNLRRRVTTSPEVSPSPPPAKSPMTQYRKTSPESIGHLPILPWSAPVGPRSKRPGNGNLTERNFSVMAAAAAAVEAKEEDEDDEEDEEEEEEEKKWQRQLPVAGRKMRRPVEEREGVGDGYKRLANAITRLGEIYEKVEMAKQRQMVELEKQRMQFTKDLEIQRMKLFMDSQVQVEKLKRMKKNCTAWQAPTDHFGNYQ